ncbi:hypothetical protein DdX_01361 [Ditylenchus destructor]|uniref:Uncharacterized protein n=1 Tax=Ditylenchus destructor TaxID=166010 RepID=A0AAD4RDV7_9BILA|nr:hypothetical protein DdX_01361 [Ditylenchus destructor]
MLLRGIMIIIALEYSLTDSPGPSAKYPGSGNHMVKNAVEIFGNICSVFLLLSPAVAFPLIFLCLAALVAEHSRLAVEFATDQNNYQLSVIRHYVSANQMLKNVLYSFRKHIASVWISIQLLICVTVIVIAARSQTVPSTTEHWFRILAICDAMLILLCLAIITSIFNGTQSALQDKIAYMIAGDKTFSIEVTLMLIFIM